MSRYGQVNDDDDDGGGGGSDGSGGSDDSSTSYLFNWVQIKRNRDSFSF